MKKLKTIEIMEDEDFIFENKESIYEQDIIRTQQIMDSNGKFGLRIFYKE